MNDKPKFDSREGAGQRLTRKRVADRLGVSVSTVRRMEGTALHPTRENGINYFDPEEVDKFAPRVRRRQLTEGQFAARAFTLFENGCDVRRVVTELELPPAKVRALYREWFSPDLRKGEQLRQQRERNEEARQDAREHYRAMREFEDRMTRLLGTGAGE